MSIISIPALVSNIVGKGVEKSDKGVLASLTLAN